MSYEELLANTQIIFFNPVLKRSGNSRKQYFEYLKKTLRYLKWNKRKYCKAQLEFYGSVLCKGEDSAFVSAGVADSIKTAAFLSFDIAHISGYCKQLSDRALTDGVVNMIVKDFDLSEDASGWLNDCFSAAMGEDVAWERVLRDKLSSGIRRSLRQIRKNLEFIRKRPCRILVTATMSAGKSTVINALTGKYVCLMKNMACTEKIHTIVSKRYEDTVISEYDYDLCINATRDELMTNNRRNQSDKITVGTYFDSLIGGQRIVLYDSPGVNYSGNSDHARVSSDMIGSKRYDLLVYVMNATQLGTTDDAKHLNTIKKLVGRKPIVFVINKIDELIGDDEAVTDIVERQREHLISMGFKDPVVCPVSARAALLAKKGRHSELSRMERNEAENYADSFDMQSLSVYYEKIFGLRLKGNTKDEKEMLLINSGFKYFEKILDNFINRGEKGDTGIR